MAGEAERLDHFMARANAAYYAGHDPFADFTTAPEISQMFGEILGVWVITAWMAAGRPDPFLLVEPGPGRGTLMRDLLRGVRAAAPACAKALRVHFIETSTSLRARQAALVPDATWHDRLDSVPDGPMILIANEFLDALPIRQFVYRPPHWRERYVAKGAFIERALTQAETAVVPLRTNLHPGAVVEINEPARRFVAAVANRVVRNGAAALFIDYGPARSGTGDTLQAIAARRMTDPLIDPGHADLTAHVDFADLAEIAQSEGALVHGPVEQGTFLIDWGLLERAKMLSARNPAEAETLALAVRRLTDANSNDAGAMGRLFKVMALSPPGWPTLIRPALDQIPAQTPPSGGVAILFTTNMPSNLVTRPTRRLVAQGKTPVTPGLAGRSQADACANSVARVTTHPVFWRPV